MPETLRTLEDTLALMARYGGTKWPNPWWPSGNSNYDDCAAAVSWALFGLNSYGNPFYSYVSQIQNYFSGIGRRTWGRSGIRRGDVLAFSWTQDPNSFDHTEIALGPVSPAGLITSRGTNSNPGDDMRDRTRSALYVVSFARPDYAGTSTAADGTSNALTSQQKEEEDMLEAFALRNGDGSGSIGLVSPDGTLDGLTGDDWNALLRCGFIKPNEQFPKGYSEQTDGTVWGILARRTSRLRAAKAGDPAAIAKSTAALVIPAVIAALKANGAAGLTQQEVEGAAETAIRAVFADVAD